jgi:hypothetical protein
MNINFKTYIDKLNIEKNGFQYIVVGSLVYLLISYIYIKYFDIVITIPKSIKEIDFASITKFLPILFLNLVSVFSYIIYCKNINDEKKANKLGGNFILMPFYIAILYLSFRAVSAIVC